MKPDNSGLSLPWDNFKPGDVFLNDNGETCVIEDADASFDPADLALARDGKVDSDTITVFRPSEERHYCVPMRRQIGANSFDPS